MFQDDKAEAIAPYKTDIAALKKAISALEKQKKIDTRLLAERQHEAEEHLTLSEEKEASITALTNEVKAWKKKAMQPMKPDPLLTAQVSELELLLDTKQEEIEVLQEQLSAARVARRTPPPPASYRRSSHPGYVLTPAPSTAGPPSYDERHDERSYEPPPYYRDSHRDHQYRDRPYHHRDRDGY